MSKDETLKHHIGGIWKAMTYIEKNIEEELSLDKISKAAGFSPFHFHRIFYAFTNESINDYVRRLRMEKAASRLKYGGKPVTDIALDSGYGTPSSFCRAFAKVMGVSPKHYRFKGIEECKQAAIHQLKKERKMIQPEFIKLEDKEVLFVRKTGSYYTSASDAWKSIIKLTKDVPNIHEKRKFGIALDDPHITDEAKLRFDACISAPKERVESKEVGRQVIPGGKFAVFVHTGPYDQIKDTFKDIFSGWYPDYQGETAERPCVLEYMNMELMRSNPEKLITKIYVPLK